MQIVHTDGLDWMLSYIGVQQFLHFSFLLPHYSTYVPNGIALRRSLVLLPYETNEQIR